MKSFMHLWEIYVTTIDLVLREIGGGYAELLLATVEEGVCHAIRRYTLIALGKSPKVERECKPESNLGVSLDYCSVPGKFIRSFVKRTVAHVKLLSMIIEKSLFPPRNYSSSLY
jgi:hypothetical protein